MIFETAAAHATMNVPVARASQSAHEARAMLHRRAYESASHIVVCEGDRFVGIATIEAVLAAPDNATVTSLMDRDAPVVAPGVDQEVAAWRAVRHGESALALVDEAGRFAGVIPPHRLVAVLLAEHEEDLSRLAGFLKTTSAARLTSEEPVRYRFWHRLPWLLLGLAGALIAADLVGRFDDLLRINVVLAFFMPGIVYLADAVGTQTETVVVRGLSLGVPMRRMMAREVLTGVVIGATLAVVTAPLVWWRWHDAALALSMSVSVLAASSTATIAAMLLPAGLTSVKLDPAFGSGPIATVLQDLISIWIYLTVTTVMMT